MKFTDHDDLIDDAIDEKPRARSDRTSDVLQSLLEAADRQFRARHAFKQAFAAAADQMGKDGGSPQQQRQSLRNFEGDFDGQDHADMLVGAFLRRLGNLPGALEPTVAAVAEAVIGCDSLADSLKHFDAAAKGDKKIHGAKGRTLVKQWPRYGAPAQEDRDQIDERELGQALEAQDKKAGR